jgi:hypothetical protein
MRLKTMLAIAAALMLGPGGANTLNASVPGFPGTEVTFTATVP